MSIATALDSHLSGAGRRVMLVCAILAIELIVIVAIQAAGEFGCTRDGATEMCNFFARLAIRGAAIAALGALYLMTRGRRLVAQDGARGPLAWPWPQVQIAGFVLVLSPVLPGGPSFAGTAPALVAWGVGSVLAAVGAMFWLIPPAGWKAIWRKDGAVLAALAVAGSAAPEFVAQADRLWQWNPLAGVTFDGVVYLLALFGEPFVDAEHYLVGLNDFVVQVGEACSGVQGFALILSFLAVYFLLQRQELSFSRAWLLVPLGLACSFALNIIRITALILIGASGSPELAVSGFHSNAGWFLFTSLAFVLIFAARRFASRRDAGPAVAEPPFLGDPTVAMILPFIVFMLSGVFLAAASETPHLLYPLRTMALALVLLPFAPLVLDMVRGADLRAVAVGLAVGLLWIALPGARRGDPTLAAELESLAPAEFLVWAGFRLLGTIVLVPIVEEAFFRGYLLRRLARGGSMRLLALIVSSVAFAVLHERWFAAGLAGLAFGALMLRRNRLADSIAAHVAANAMVVAGALASGDWSLL